MFKLFARKRKAVSVAMSAMLVATAFTGAGSCTLNVDRDLLGQAADLLGGFDGPGPGGGPGFAPDFANHDPFDCDGGDAHPVNDYEYEWDQPSDGEHD